MDGDIDNNDEFINAEEEITKIDRKNIRTTKDGKKMMIFSGDQENTAKAIRDKIPKKNSIISK